MTAEPVAGTSKRVHTRFARESVGATRGSLTHRSSRSVASWPEIEAGVPYCARKFWVATADTEWMAGGWPYDDSRSARMAGGLAVLLTLIALLGSTRAALHRAPRDPGDGAAGVIPDVVYTEQEHVSLATIAQVNAAIGEEVTRDEVAPVASDQERSPAMPASGGTPSERPAVVEETKEIDRAVKPTDDTPSDTPTPDGANKDEKPGAESTTTTAAPTDTSEPSNPGRHPPRSSETTTTTEPAPQSETTTTTEPQKPKGKKR